MCSNNSGSKNHQAAITISSVRRIHGKAILTLSTGETLSMPRAMLREKPYKSGMLFDHGEHEAFLNNRSYSFAMEKAGAALTSRARTEKELVDTLIKNAYPEQTIARVMAYLVEAGYIKDAAFAQQWAASRSSKGLGSRRIRMELRQKGIRQEDIDEAVSSVGEDAELRGAIMTAEKASRGKDLNSPADRQRILAALARRGYGYSVAKHAINTLLNGK